VSLLTRAQPRRPCPVIRGQQHPSLKIFLNIFTKEEISELLIKTGFRIVETKTRDATSSEEFSFRKLILFAQAI